MWLAILIAENTRSQVKEHMSRILKCFEVVVEVVVVVEAAHRKCPSSASFVS